MSVKFYGLNRDRVETVKELRNQPSACLRFSSVCCDEQGSYLLLLERLLTVM